MEFSWDLLESTMEKVNNVLGDTIRDINIEQEMADQMVKSDYEIPMEVINDHLLHSNGLYNGYTSDESVYSEQNYETLETGDNVAEDILPQNRERSNTWPRRRLGPSLKMTDPDQSFTLGNNYLPFVSEEGSTDQTDLVSKNLGIISLPKKNSRRNPWGNYSYSDLIVQAIVTSPEQRLTLNDIYDWMIFAIPYFSDRQDNVSSAGWKNSIRHNLSLHQKFLKIPNEDAGKSSWWMINPDIKQTIKPRRRATYGESVEKAKKRAEAVRNKGRLLRASSTNGLSTLSLPHATENFHIRSNSSASSCDDNSLSPFRPRSFSNASSNSRTSPPHLPELTIPNFSQLVETDLDEIRLDDLNLGFQPNIPHSSEIIREYLNPRAQETEDKSFIYPEKFMHNVTILEPRSNETVGNSVIKLENSNQTLYSNMDDLLLGSLRGPEMIEKHAEERKKMIKNELNNLITKRREIAHNESTLSFDNKKNLESACDMQIKLLQDELDKLDGVKSEITNPSFFFSVD